MKQGRHICNTLKAIRKQIAETNDIHYEPRECHHEGDCAGTCPACEAEVRYLEGELSKRRRLGRAVSLVGISAGLAALQGCGLFRVFQPTAGIPVMPPEQQAKQQLVAADSTEEMQVMSKPPIITTDSIRPVKNDEKVLDGIVEEMPQFPGGDEALMEYMKKNIRYPDECVQGRVIVSFTIEKDGSISGAKVIKSVSQEADKEALRLVNNMPKWIPGKQLGEPVRTKYTIPVVFRLE
jgi:TonB family protein